MVKIFQIIAVILAGVAALLYWKESGDWAFAAGVLAISSFFLSVRFQFKARINERELERSSDDPGEESTDRVETETGSTGSTDIK